MTGTDVTGEDLDQFEAVRGRLFGIAYRMLGTVSDAEDVVQEAWLRWQRADRRNVDNPAAFLTTATTRLAMTASARGIERLFIVSNPAKLRQFADAAT